MGKFQSIIAVSLVVTFVIFGLMLYLMTTVNPPPLSTTTTEVTKPEVTTPKPAATPKPDDAAKDPNSQPAPAVRDLIRVMLGPQTTVNETKSVRSKYDKNLYKYSIQRVVPPVWPPIPNLPTNETVGSPGKRALNETEIHNAESTINDTLSVIKRSVNDVKQLGGDLNSIALKIMDDSGQFNIEIKIGLNDAIVQKKNETREDKIQSKDKSDKYSIFLETKDNDQLKKTKLAKNTIIRVIPNDFVTVVEYDEHLEAKNKIKNNNIQASIVDFNNITKYYIIENKATVMPIHRTKSIYHSDTKAKKGDLLQKPNDVSDESKTDANSFKKANNTTYNVTTQTEKGDEKTEKGDLLQKLNDVSDESKTDVNSFKTSNSTTYNVTTQTEKGDEKTEKGDLLHKLNDVSDESKTNVNSFKTANNTTYNVTTQTKKGDEKTEKGDLLQKLNDVSDESKTNFNSFKTANNTTYNVTTQTEKGDEKTEKGDLLQKPNDVSNESKTNANSFKTANNTTYNITTRTEKGTKN